MIVVTRQSWVQRKLVSIFIEHPDRRFSSEELVPLVYFGEPFTDTRYQIVWGALSRLTAACVLGRVRVPRGVHVRGLKYLWFASEQLIAPETRSSLTADVRDYAVRFAPEDSGTFTGHAAIFGERNNHNEIVKRGAFTRTLADHKARGVRPPMLWAHDQREPIGVWESITEDATGLAVRGRLVTETTRGREALALLKAGALSGLSIGFRPVHSTRNAKGVRELSEIELGEISLVTIPSAGNARIINVRSAATFHRAVASAIAALKGA
jgi:HK97 family phage prohead protease